MGKTPQYRLEFVYEQIRLECPMKLACCAALLLSSGIGRAVTFYVKTNGDDALSGVSWALAKQSITNSMSSASAGDQIWVASGTYTQLVTLKPSVALYGGFNGTEAILAERNWKTNVSWIYGASMGPAVSINGGGPDTRLDGMAITGGSGIFGGGISCSGAGPVIANNFIYGNKAEGGIGGGMYLNFHQTVPPADPVVTNNTIYQNTTLGSIGEGAGITVRNSSPLIAWNRVLFNVAGDKAGGIACFGNSHPTIANNLIEANAASADSIGFGGGILATYNDYDGQPVNFAISDPIIINNIIAANGADSGGGVALVDAPVGAATLVNNTIIANTGSGIFWGNTSPTNCNNLIAFNSAGLESDGSPAVLRNNDVYSNSVLSQVTDFMGLPSTTGMNGNISADPILGNYRIGDFQLQPASPCVKAGLTAAVVAGWPDIAGSNRVSGAAVDIGAYESSGAILNVAARVIHVSPGGDDTKDGLTWATAKRTVQAAINAAAPAVTLGGEVWVGQGIYTQHILIPAFVYLYGGFVGSETNRADRNITGNPSIVDGGGQPTVVQSLSAGYLVSTLDGFTVQNGGVYTDGQLVGLWPNGLGGGIECQISAPIIANNVIRSNSLGNPFGSNGTAKGGGIYLYIGHAQVLNNSITRNDVLDTTAGSGGGIYCIRSKPTITGNTFHLNHAVYGAAIAADLLSSVRIIGNVVLTNFMYDSLPSPTYQGAFDGAILLTGCNGFLIQGNTIQGNWADVGAGLDLKASQNGVVQNNVIYGNLAYEPVSQSGMGGGIYCEVDGAVGNITIVNNTIVGNAGSSPFAGDQGGGVALDLPLTNTVVLANNIISSNSGGIYLRIGSQAPAAVGYRNNCVVNPVNYTGLSAGLGDIHLDPGFSNSAAGDFHLLPSSPCIDAGTVLDAAATDKDGTPRPLDGKNSGAAAFDIGAYEFANPNADTDHDGMPDQAELIAGTNPTDPASFLQLQAQASSDSNSTLLSWLSVTGRTYTVQFKTALTGSAWQALSNNLQGTGPIFSGTLLQVSDPVTTAAKRFYRLGVTKN
jgi:hypothetical protein